MNYDEKMALADSLRAEAGKVKRVSNHRIKEFRAVANRKIVGRRVDLDKDSPDLSHLNSPSWHTWKGKKK